MQEYRFEKNLSCVIFVLLFLGLAAEIPITFLNLYRMQEMAYLSFWDKIGHILSSFWYGGNAFAVLLAVGYDILCIILLKSVCSHTLQKHESQWLVLLPGASLIIPIYNLISSSIMLTQLNRYLTPLGEYLKYRIPEIALLLLTVLTHVLITVELKRGKLVISPLLTALLLAVTLLNTYVFSDIVSLSLYDYSYFTWETYLSLVVAAGRVLWWLLLLCLLRRIRTAELPYPEPDTFAKPRFCVRIMIAGAVGVYFLFQVLFVMIYKYLL